MGLSLLSSHHLNRLAESAYHVSPITKKGVPSALLNACPLAEGLRKPRRKGFSVFSFSVQSIAVKDPVLPDNPASLGVEPLFHFHVPDFVAITRTRKVVPPSQKPYTLL